MRWICWGARLLVFGPNLLMGIYMVVRAWIDSERPHPAHVLVTFMSASMILLSMTGQLSHLREASIYAWFLILYPTPVLSIVYLHGSEHCYFVLSPIFWTFGMVMKGYLEFLGMQSVAPVLTYIPMLVTFVLAMMICSTYPKWTSLLGLVGILNCMSLLLHTMFSYVQEWLLFCIRFLEFAFDAICVVTVDGDGNVIVANSSERLDRIFEKSMENCILDGAIILVGHRTLSEILTSAKAEGGSQSARSNESIRQMFVTCRDAKSWEFDAELRISRKKNSFGLLVGCKASTEMFICGIRMLGEKRQPIDIHECQGDPAEEQAEESDVDELPLPNISPHTWPQGLEGHVVFDFASESADRSSATSSTFGEQEQGEYHAVFEACSQSSKSTAKSFPQSAVRQRKRPSELPSETKATSSTGVE